MSEDGKDLQNLEKFGNPEIFSEKSFWKKIKTIVKIAGLTVVKMAVLLYIIMKSPHTPKKIKLLIISALAYLISPLDAAPDIMPLIGYLDDIGVMSVALFSADKYATIELKAEADNIVKSLFS